MQGASELKLTGHALTPRAQRSWWLREALASEDARHARPSLGTRPQTLSSSGAGSRGCGRPTSLRNSDQSSVSWCSSRTSAVADRSAAPN